MVLLHAEVSFGTFADDESALSGKGVHFGLYEVVQTSGVTVGGSHKSFSFVGNEVIGKGAEVTFLVNDFDGHVAEVFGVLVRIDALNHQVVGFGGCADRLARSFFAVLVVGYDFDLSFLIGDVEPHEAVSR